MLREVLPAEVNRLVRVAAAGARRQRPATTAALREALVEVLAGFAVYRAYLPPTGPADEQAREHVDAAVAAARKAVPAPRGEIDVVRSLVLAEGPDGPDAQEFVTRFQQTCGPVMAKGVEDTAFYRYLRLSALNEVGGDPGRFGLPVAEFHRACQEQQEQWPLSMTTLSTHDTKRSEDVRARLVLLSQCPREWAETVTGWSAAAEQHRSPAGPDAATEQLVWQTLVGAWPISADRAVAYVEKATREAKAQTSWTDPVPEFDEAVQRFVRGVLGDERLTAGIAAFVARLTPAWQQTALAQKAVQLTMPGRRRHLPGHRALGPVAGRPGQPPARRLRPPAARRSPRSTALRAGRRRHRQAAPRRDAAAAAPRAPELFLAESSYEGLSRPATARSRSSAAAARRHRGADALAAGRAGRLGRRRRRPARRDVARRADRCDAQRACTAGRAARRFPVAVLVRA